MSKIKGKNTTPELLVRKHLYHKGYRYRVNYPAPGKPDIAFPHDRIAIFINGCFWHVHGCKDSVMPKTNVDFWEKKLLGNKERDKKNQTALKKAHWKFIIIWECDIKNNFQESMDILVDFINRNRKNN